MNIYTTTMTSNGQITIPKALREMLNIFPGQEIEIKQERNAIKIEQKKTVKEVLQAMDEIKISNKIVKNIEKYRGITASEATELIMKKKAENDRLKDKYGA